MTAAVVPLAQRPELLPSVAQWIFDEWWRWNPLNSVETVATLLREHLVDDAVPATFVALEGGAPVGSASLVPHLIGTAHRAELTPWVWAVYVLPAHRRRGIGSALLTRLVRYAEARGFGRVYLAATDQVAFYARLGWRVYHRFDADGDRVSWLVWQAGGRAGGPAGG